MAEVAEAAPMDAEEAPKSAVVPDEATIAKATVEMLTGDAEVVAAYGAGTLTVRVLMTAVAGKLGVTDAAQAKAFVKPTVKATLMDYMAAHDPAPAEDAFGADVDASSFAAIETALGSPRAPEVD